MEKLREIFGNRALTWEEFERELGKADGLKLANLADGEYVGKSKFDANRAELIKANAVIRELQERVDTFGGADIDTLRGELEELRRRYEDDIAAARLDTLVNTALAASGAINPRLARSAINMAAVTLDGDRAVGLDAEIESLRKSDPYLFRPVSAPHVRTASAHGASGVDVSLLTDEEYYAIKLA
ncbi:MAG: phage scaffolding protein [Oscillospiraceae bacterium]|nr:phage scaffolding protein [Oscillospiraceae bacterium]